MRLTRKISKRRKKEKKDHNIEDAIDVDKLMQSDEMEEPHKNNQLVEEE